MNKIESVMIGKTRHTFSFEGETLWECVRAANRHMFDEITKCGLCESDNLDLRAYYPGDEYKYLKVVCRDCKASLTFGNPKKNPEIYYPRRNSEDGSFKWETYGNKE